MPFIVFTTTRVVEMHVTLAASFSVRQSAVGLAQVRTAGGAARSLPFARSAWLLACFVRSTLGLHLVK